MELAEDCMEYLREEQARLLVFLREERWIPQEEAEQYLEARRRTGRLSRERLLPRQEQVRLAEELERERANHLEAQQETRQEREGQEWERCAPRRRVEARPVEARAPGTPRGSTDKLLARFEGNVGGPTGNLRAFEGKAVAVADSAGGWKCAATTGRLPRNNGFQVRGG